MAQVFCSFGLTSIGDDVAMVISSMGNSGAKIRQGAKPQENDDPHEQQVLSKVKSLIIVFFLICSQILREEAIVILFYQKRMKSNRVNALKRIHSAVNFLKLSSDMVSSSRAHNDITTLVV